MTYECKACGHAIELPSTLCGLCNEDQLDTRNGGPHPALEAQCPLENRRGVRCTKGARHKSPCRFHPLRLTDRQLHLLHTLAVGPQEVFGSSPTAKSLVGMGLIQRAYIGQRWWRLSIVAYGRAVLAEEKL